MKDESISENDSDYKVESDEDHEDVKQKEEEEESEESEMHEESTSEMNGNEGMVSFFSLRIHL